MSSGRSERRRSREAQEEANRIARERLEWQQGQMDQYDQMYGGLERQMIGEAERGAQADIHGVTARAASDVQQAFDQDRGQQRRQMASHGLDPTSGRYQGLDRQMGLQAAKAEAGAVNGARQQERAQSQ